MTDIDEMLDDIFSDVFGDSYDPEYIDSHIYRRRRRRLRPDELITHIEPDQDLQKYSRELAMALQILRNHIGTYIDCMTLGAAVGLTESAFRNRLRYELSDLDKKALGFETKKGRDGGVRLEQMD